MLGGAHVRTPQTSPGERPSAAIRTGDARAAEEKRPRPATPARCEKSDLLVDQCGCAECRPDLAEGPAVPAVLPIRYVGSWAEAAHPGVCGCGCETRFPVGTEIACADVENGARPRSRAWCLLEHTRDAVFEGGH